MENDAHQSVNNIPRVPSKEIITRAQKGINEIINVKYMANLHTSYVIFQDVKGNTIRSDEVNGYTHETVAYHGQVPAGWKLIAGQTVPTSIEFGTDGHVDITLALEHVIENVDHDKPLRPGTQTPTGMVIDGAHEGDLNQIITRTINVKKPAGMINAMKQAAHIYRDATYDAVTGEVAYGDWSADDKSWADFKPDQITGYTVSQADVPAVTVRDGQKDVTVNIAYTANDQITRIIYVDQDGNKVKTDTINGKTDQTVDTNSMVPSGWKIIDGKVPEKVHLTGTPTPDTTITIDHNETAVNHNSPVDPGAKTPTGRDIKGAHENDLNQTITRTINVTAPNGKTATTKQVAKLHRDAVIDDVTGDVTYGKWTEDAWVDFQPGQIAGYTVSQAVVPAFTVKNGQKGQIVNINYVANKQAANVVYKDGDQVVKTIPVGGKTDQTVDLNYVVPEHYTIINQDRLPKDYTF